MKTREGEMRKVGNEKRAGGNEKKGGGNEKRGKLETLSRK